MRGVYEGTRLKPFQRDNESNSNSEVAKCEFLVVPSLQPINEALLCQDLYSVTESPSCANTF